MGWRGNVAQAPRFDDKKKTRWEILEVRRGAPRRRRRSARLKSVAQLSLGGGKHNGAFSLAHRRRQRGPAHTQSSQKPPQRPFFSPQGATPPRGGRESTHTNTHTRTQKNQWGGEHHARRAAGERRTLLVQSVVVGWWWSAGERERNKVLWGAASESDVFGRLRFGVRAGAEAAAAARARSHTHACARSQNTKSRGIEAGGGRRCVVLGG